MRGVVLRAALLAAVLAVLGLPAVQAAPRPAPAFTLHLLNGKTLSLSDLKGSPVILLFWAPWCPTCNGEAAGWERTYQQWQGRGVKFVGIGLLDTEPAVEKFVQHYHLTFPNGYDGNGQVAKLYGFTYQPFWAVISTQGQLLRAGYGPSDQQELVAAIASLLRP